MKQITPSGKALADRLAAEKLSQGLSQKALAEKLGVSQPSVSAWLAGTTRPEPEVREALENLFGIPFDGWYTPEEAEVAGRFRAKPNDDAPTARVAA